MFATAVGCHLSTASRLRSGERLPSRELLGRIVRIYELSRDEAFDAFTAGPATFGLFLQSRVFVDKETAS